MPQQAAELPPFIRLSDVPLRARSGRPPAGPGLGPRPPSDAVTDAALNVGGAHLREPLPSAFRLSPPEWGCWVTRCSVSLSETLAAPVPQQAPRCTPLLQILPPKSPRPSKSKTLPHACHLSSCPPSRPRQRRCGWVVTAIGGREGGSLPSPEPLRRPVPAPMASAHDGFVGPTPVLISFSGGPLCIQPATLPP